MRVNPLGEAVIFPFSPSALKLSAVLAVAIQLKVERILESSELRRTDRLFRQYRGNEKNSFRLGQNQVSRQHYSSPNTNRCINRSQLHLRPCRWIVPSIESVEVTDLAVFRLVANTAVEHEPGMRMRGYGV